MTVESRHSRLGPGMVFFLLLAVACLITMITSMILALTGHFGAGLITIVAAFPVAAGISVGAAASPRPRSRQQDTES